MALPNVINSDMNRVGRTSRFFHSGRDRVMVKVFPGGVYTTHDPEIICTGLGSCISACVWDKYAQVGGMNHFMLPFDETDDIEHWHPTEILSSAARYGNHAMELLINQVVRHGASRDHLSIKLFGGGSVIGKQILVGEKNIEFILDYVKQEHFELVSSDLGGRLPRKIMFDPMTGQAWVRKLSMDYARTLEQDEEKYSRALYEETHAPHDNDAELF